MRVYFIPGLGADYRLFTHIQLPEGYTPSYIHWIDPYEKEKLSDYAYRLTTQIDTTEPFILVGLSLGGMMAVEIAKRTDPVCTILISSIPVIDHLPKYFRAAGKLGVNKVFPASFWKIASSTKHALTMRPASKRKLMFDIIWDGDDRFIRWAINAVLEWENKEVPKNFYHIHGTRDEIFPIGLTTPTHIVKKADHMFVMSKPETANSILKEIILDQPRSRPASQTIPQPA